MIAFYRDHQFRAGVTRGLRQRAVELNRVLVTHDKDFLRIGAHCQQTRREFSGVVFAIQEHLDMGRAIDYLEVFAQVMVPEEMRNQIEYGSTR